MELSNIRNQTGLAESYKTLHPNTKEYTVFLAAHGTVSPKLTTDLDTKQGSTENKKIEITPSILPDHHRLKLDTNNGHH